VPGGVTWKHIAGNASAKVIITATPEEIDATLADDDGLIYTPDLDFRGDDTLTVETDDLGNTGAPAGMSAVDAVTIHVLSVLEQTEKLSEQINHLLVEGTINSGQAAALTNHLTKLQFKNVDADASKVIAFIDQVGDFVTEGILTPEQGAELTTAADEILSGVLSNSLTPSSEGADSVLADFDSLLRGLLMTQS
jgi:hypothetical protein